MGRNNRKMGRGPARGVTLLALLVTVLLAVPVAAQAATRTWWIAAVPRPWNIVPNERDAINDMTFTPQETMLDTVVYRAFTPHWRRVIPSLSRGIAGPLIRARVGDHIVVHFKNLDTLFNRPHSMHFHGVRYRPSSDGAYVPGFSGRDADVRPGQTWTYRLTALPGSVGVWPYHDHSPSMMESIAGGLYGAMSIRGRHEPVPNREFVVFFAGLGDFMTIDGRSFVGNTPVFHARVGDLVQWDVLTLGDDFHTFHVHGHRWRGPGGAPQDTRSLGPAESFRVQWREEDPGTWLYHCHVESHMMRGMIGLYRVSR